MQSVCVCVLYVYAVGGGVVCEMCVVWAVQCVCVCVVYVYGVGGACVTFVWYVQYGVGGVVWEVCV